MAVGGAMVVDEAERSSVRTIIVIAPTDEERIARIREARVVA